MFVKIPGIQMVIIIFTGFTIPERNCYFSRIMPGKKYLFKAPKEETK